MNTETLSTPQGTPITADWQRIGATRGFQPPDVTELRIALFGRPGCGKTELLMQIPDALILDYDLAAQSITRQVATRLPMVDHPNQPVWDYHEAVIKKLEDDASAGHRRFSRICFDTVDRWFDANGRKAVAVWNAGENRQKNPGSKATSLLGIKDEGSMWGQARDAVYRDLARLTQAGYSWLVTGHVQRERAKVGGETVDFWMPTLNYKMAAHICSLSEYVLNLNRTVTKAKGTKVINGKTITFDVPGQQCEYSLLTTPTDDQVDVKMRIALAQQRIVFPQFGGWDLFTKSYVEACDKVRAEYANPAQPTHSKE